MEAEHQIRNECSSSATRIAMDRWKDKYLSIRHDKNKFTNNMVSSIHWEFNTWSG
jgi:hypothetical protein